MATTTAATAAWLKHETACIIHIAGTLSPAQLDFRFTPAQRSTLELLRYLAICNEGLLSFLLTGTWDRWTTLQGQVANLDLTGFAKAMKAQQKRVEKLLATIPPRALASRIVTLGNGTKLPLGAAIEHYLHKMPVGYKMQLFLQAKAAGVSTIASSDLWMGKKAKPKKA